MWQKINKKIYRLFVSSSVPIFTKMVLMYSIIVFFILLIVSVITITSIHYIITDAICNNLIVSADTTIAYLNKHGKMDNSIYEQSALQPFINLHVYNESGELISQSNTTSQSNALYFDDHLQQTNITVSPVNAVKENGHGIFTLDKKWDSPEGRHYHLLFFRRVVKENAFFDLLSKQLLISVLISLFLTILSGMYLMKKFLAPLSVIRDTLNNIEVNKLGKRIVLSDQKNEMYDLAFTINQTLDRIEDGYKQQQQFISDASHELRTPITVIAGYADMLDRWGKDDAATLEEGIDAIKYETEYMRQLIERLLFLARSNSGTLSSHFTKIDSAALLLEVYNAVGLISDHRTIILDKNESAAIYAEPGSVKQMLRIFIDNAIKYTSSTGSIFLSCKVKNNNVYFEVRDTGIGIPEKDLDHVFERFYRVDTSRTKDTGGIGLGLSIAQYIAKANNATLSLDSKLNEGTTVTAIFPTCENMQDTMFPPDTSTKSS